MCQVGSYEMVPNQHFVKKTLYSHNFGECLKLSYLIPKQMDLDAFDLFVTVECQEMIFLQQHYSPMSKH